MGAEEETPNGRVMRETLETAGLVAINTHQESGETFVGANGERSRIDYVITTKGQYPSVDARVLKATGEMIWEATRSSRSTRRTFMDHYPVAMRWKRRDAVLGIYISQREEGGMEQEGYEEGHKA